jgi:hypothetical protein
MSEITGICSHCFGLFKKYHDLFACELKEIKCNKTKEEAYICKNMKCKFMFAEDDFYECDHFILCDECFNDPKKVQATIENYIDIFGVADCAFPEIEYKK